ncbi:MAG: carbohydrate ABC transporter permease [Synergistaceae bacterium]|jgi:sn-glycerol 3-phosphate transport system permease protein|nr:carbohydrate ABC transporter permease [Synergistaceae bacterium]
MQAAAVFRKTFGTACRIAVNLLIFAIFFIPFYWMFLTAIKNLGQTLQTPPVFWVSKPHWENFSKVFAAIPFFHMLKNNLIMTFGIMICQFFTVIPAAYAFARFRFAGSGFLFGLTLATMMIPAQLVFLPLFLMFSRMGLINSYASLILPWATSSFAIFMLRQTFKQVPRELIEAAKLDSASEWKIIFKLMLPIAKPTIVTLGLITFILNWNDYFWPFVLTTNNAVRTLPVGITSLNIVDGGVKYHILMAGNLLLVAPVLVAFFFAQKQIIKAFTYMGGK